MKVARVGTTQSLRRRAMNFILLMGLVALFGDIIFAAAHSITGPYLGILGASAVMIGFISGLADFLGYSLRMVFGFLSALTGRYWTITILGYVVNLVAAPLLALVGQWETAALLIILERCGMAIRTQARDAMLTHATVTIGRGWGFGIHEAMNQIGSILGPLLISLVLYLNMGYSQGFALLAIPAGLAIICLILARPNYPNPMANQGYPAFIREGSSARTPFFWLYTCFSFFTLAGFSNFPLISFHMIKTQLVPGIQIPIFFAIAMGVEGIFALLAGRLYGRIGALVLIFAPLLTIPLPFLAFSQSYLAVILGMIFWGAALALQVSVLRFVIIDLCPISHKGSAYGIFNGFFGFALLLGNTVMGILYSLSIAAIGYFVLAMEGFSLALLWLILRQHLGKPRERQT